MATSPRNELTLDQIYVIEVATGYLRYDVIAQQNQPAGFNNMWTIINTATALNASLVAYASNWSNLP